MIGFSYKKLDETGGMYERYGFFDSLFKRWAGISPAWVCAVKAGFPNAGFNRRLVTLTCRQFQKNPRYPLPMVCW
jgi:hypothetical protein